MPTFLPSAMDRNSGPWLMRAKSSQVLRAATGQVASLEPRPISTSRQPVLPRTRDDDAVGQKFDPACAINSLIGAAVEADDFGAAQPSGKAQHQDGAVAQVSQVVAERRDHAQKLSAEHWFLLVRRLAVTAADAAHHLSDVAIGTIERGAMLIAMPADRREPALDGAHGIRLFAPVCGCRSRQIEANRLWIRGQGVEIVAAAPGGVVPPVGRISALGGRCLGAAGIVLGGFNQTFKVGRNGGRWNDGGQDFGIVIHGGLYW